LIIGVGKKATGGTGWSYSNLFSFEKPMFSIKEGILAIEFENQ